MLIQILLMIVDTVAAFVTSLLLARFIMQWLRMSFRNPLGTFVIAATDWLVRPARRIIPGLFGLDLPSLIPAWLLQALVLLLVTGLHGFNFGPLALPAILAAAAVETVRLGIYLVIFVVIGSAVLSWVNPYSPLAPVLNAVAGPLLRPFQRILPPIGNVDLSPLVLLLVLQVVQFILGGLKSGLLGMML